MASQPAWDLFSKPEEVLDDDALLEDESDESALNDDEQWHVLMGPGEVKVLSLEQLDDFFRLEIIDENTFVWQEGMKDWAPLSIVAGIDKDQEDEKPTEPIGSPPPQLMAPPPPFSVPPASTTRMAAHVPAPHPASVAPSAPPPASVAPQAASPFSPAPSAFPPSVAPQAASAPPPASATRSAFPPSVAPQAASAPPPASVIVSNDVASGAPASAPPPAALSSSWVPPAVPLSQGPTSVAAPASSSLSPSSLSPVSVESTEVRPQERSSRWPVIALAAAGLLLTLYRNDLLRDAAAAAGQASLYDAIEGVIGAPGFGTPRSVEEPEAEVLPAETPTSQLATTTATPSAPVIEEEEPSTAAKDVAEPEEKEAPAATAPSAPSAQRATPTRTPTTTAPRKTTTRSTSSAPAPKKTTKSRNSEYDPMNASL